MTRPRNAQVLLASEHHLVTESVAAALNGRGVDTTPLAWPSGPGSGPEPAVAMVADVGLAVSELDGASLREVRSLIVAVPIPWIVVTSAPRGEAWCRVLEVGASAVLDHTTTLDQLARILADVRQGRSATPELRVRPRPFAPSRVPLWRRTGLPRPRHRCRYLPKSG